MAFQVTTRQVRITLVSWGTSVLQETLSETFIVYVVLHHHLLFSTVSGQRPLCGEDRAVIGKQGPFSSKSLEKVEQGQLSLFEL